MTVKAEATVIMPWSGFVRVKFRAETVAEGATSTFTVKEVALLNVTLLTVMPVPLKDAMASSTKPVPTTARF